MENTTISSDTLYIWHEKAEYRDRVENSRIENKQREKLNFAAGSGANIYNSIFKTIGDHLNARWRIMEIHGKWR